MTRRRLVTSLLALIALLPAAAFADDPAPPTRAWADRRHPESALQPLAAQTPAAAAADAFAAPELFPYER